MDLHISDLWATLFRHRHGLIRALAGGALMVFLTLITLIGGGKGQPWLTRHGVEVPITLVAVFLLSSACIFWAWRRRQAILISRQAKSSKQRRRRRS